MVVRMGLVAGEVGDHLVGVHVRRGSGAGLEDVDRELVVVLARGNGVARLRDLLGKVGVELPRSALALAAAAFSRPSQWITGGGTGWPEIWKFSTAFVSHLPRDPHDPIAPGYRTPTRDRTPRPGRG